MESYVYVRRPWRRHGIGRRLVRAITDEALTEARTLLIWSTYDSIPAGGAFSRRLDGTVGRVSRNSDLSLGDVDWGRVQSWVDEGPRRAPGYGLEFWEGPLPAHVRDDAAHFHHLMNLQPHDDLAIGDVVLDAADVEELDGHLAESGRQLWTLFVRDPDGRCVGGTELTFEPWEPGAALQRNTATDPDHRGIGLAKWAKAAMLLRLRSERPDVTLVRTGNAFSNDAMLAINTALGFKVVEIRTEWQTAVRDLDATLRRMNA
jgi:GNAT superfamily N-acetyltransferase